MATNNSPAAVQWSALSRFHSNVSASGEAVMIYQQFYDNIYLRSKIYVHFFAHDTGDGTPIGIVFYWQAHTPISLEGFSLC